MAENGVDSLFLLLFFSNRFYIRHSCTAKHQFNVIQHESLREQLLNFNIKSFDINIYEQQKNTDIKIEPLPGASARAFPAFSLLKGTHGPPAPAGRKAPGRAPRETFAPRPFSFSCKSSEY